MEKFNSKKLKLIMHKDYKNIKEKYSFFHVLNVWDQHHL